MRIAIAQVWQETHTFSPVATGIEDFEKNGLYLGDEILEHMQGVAEVGGFLAAGQETGGEVEWVPILRAWAASSGRVTKETLAYFERILTEGLQAALPLDGVLLSLHGASASEKVDDLEGYLLSSVRRIVGPDVPIVVSLDHHANITQLIVDSVDALVGYQTQPHDPFETGKRTADLMFAIIRREISPCIRWCKIPMMAPADLGLTSEYPMREWFGLAREMEKRPGVVSVSTFPVQPWLDVESYGWSTVAISNADPDLANRVAAEVANQAWDLRQELWKVRRVSPQEAVRLAVEAQEGPIVISDASDSVLSGAPGDSTCLLSQMLDQQITCPALLPMVDPDVVALAIKKGVGSEISTWIGGKLDPIFGKPIQITGKVYGIAPDGLYSELHWGRVDMGKTVVLEIGSIKVLVSQLRGVGGADPDVYRHFGIEPSKAQIAVVKMYFNFLAFRPIMKGSVMADCPGLSTWDLRTFEWKNVPRPIFPLDDIQEWRAET